MQFYWLLWELQFAYISNLKNHQQFHPSKLAIPEQSEQ